MLSVAIKSPEGMSFALSGLEGGGYVILDEGVTGFHSFRSYFQGNPAQGEAIRADFTGPYEDTYSFSDSVRTADGQWSPCGRERLLQVQTRIQLRRESGAGEGYMNVEKLGKIKLAWRRCNG